MVSGEADRFMPIREVQKMTSLSRASIYEKIKASDFPVPAKLGRASRWSRREIENWMSSRLASRRA